ncbi:N-acetylmuramoyl-L-alanine amidase [Plastorhodobacter daqingensis]|uniref:N-acetylmuramoyl-L-alanine amidase n=1 Tax=Plastorhodobacter daqingensis TaxID=1387281 RepID=A0ABW2UN91_9RHOB
MSGLRPFLSVVLAALLIQLAPQPVAAEGFSGRARVEPAQTVLETGRRGVVLTLALSQPVPYKIVTLNDPPRIVVDFQGVTWDGLSREALLADVRRGVRDLRFGAIGPGWSRLVIELDGPYGVTGAGLRRDEGSGLALLRLTLAPISPPEFAARARPAEEVLWDLPPRAPIEGLARPRQRGEGPLVVVLDPGHGGIDPGAERGGLREADLMLTFARELKEYLLRAGGFRVVLTRDEDAFVPLEARASIARAAGADVFLSLHADALADGDATGATIYTLSDEASDSASAALAERHDRDDLLAGVDLSGHDDLVADVLMSLARTETQPRSEALADALVAGIAARAGPMHKRPRLHAGFSVLRSPDIPSVLIELGFMSNDEDLARLRSPSWRAQTADGIVQALKGWAAADAAQAGLLRR